jgi:hypothetical protein
LLTANCDEFIFYDDLVRESQRTTARREVTRAPQPAAKRAPDADKQRKEDLDTRKTKAIEIAVQTFDALATDRGDSGKIWASVLKNAIKRRKPDFNETYYGFRAFGNLLEEAQARGLLEVGRDEKSGTFVYRNPAGAGGGETPIEHPATAHDTVMHEVPEDTLEVAETAEVGGTGLEAAADTPAEGSAAGDEPAGHRETRRQRHANRPPAAKKARRTKKAAAETTSDAPPEIEHAVETPAPPAHDETAVKPARKTTARGRRPRKAATTSDAG